jgi:hypothetical protein
MEAERLYSWQAQKYLQDVRSERSQSRDAARESLDVDFGNVSDQSRLNNEI